MDKMLEKQRVYWLADALVKMTDILFETLLGDRNQLHLLLLLELQWGSLLEQERV